MFRRKADSVAEYVVMLLTVSLALSVGQICLKRAAQGQIKGLSDNILGTKHKFYLDEKDPKEIYTERNATRRVEEQSGATRYKLDSKVTTRSRLEEDLGNGTGP